MILFQKYILLKLNKLSILKISYNNDFVSEIHTIKVK